ncbi:MAG: hypothetical protein WCQ50_09860 [Spirochaetota bacterium]
MKSIFRKRFLTCRSGRLLALTLLLGLLFADAAAARGGFSGGGFKSSPSFRPSTRSFSLSPSRVAPRASTSATPSLTPRAGGSIWGSRKAPAATASGAPASQPRLATSRSMYDNARSKGTLYANQGEASSAFRQKYGSSYGSTFAAEPSARPSYIPATTMIGGRSAGVLWNPGLGGYGYYDSLLGRWMLYDAIGDAAMATGLMAGHGYAWGAPPVYASHGPNFIDLAFGLFLLLLLIVVVLNIYSRSRRREAGGPGL